MDFNELMNLATQNDKGSDKKRGYAFNISAPKKESKQKPKSDVVQKLIAEKEREKQKVLEKQELKRIEEEKKKIFRIPKAGSPSTEEGAGKKKHHHKNKPQSGSSSSKNSTPKMPEKPKLKLEEAVFRDLQSRDESYNQKDRARINFDGSFAVVRIAHKRNEGVPLPKRPVVTPVKETPKFNVALVKKSDVVNSDNSNMNSHKATGPKEDVSESVRKLKEKYGVDPNGVKKSSTRRENKLKEIAKYKEKVKMREKLKMNAKKDPPKPFQPKPKIVKRVNNNAPPPMNFADLLKLAENKAKEPIIVDPIVKKPKKKVEEERPMTREEREWAEKKQDWADRKKSKEYQERLGKDLPPSRPSKSGDSSHKSGPKDSPISNSNRNNNNNNSVKNKDLNSSYNKPSHNTPYKEHSDRRPSSSSSPAFNGNRPTKTTPGSNKSSSSSKDQRGFEQQHKRDHRGYEQDRNREREQRGYEQDRNRGRDQRGYEQDRNRGRDQRAYEQDRNKEKDQRVYKQDRNREREPPAPNKNSRTSQPLKRKSDHPSESLRDNGPSQPKKKALPPPEEATNPWDRIYGSIQKNRPKKPVMKKKMVIDSEDEYDSELEDFIDDGDDETADYSSAIRQIFGYDKRRFRDEDDDIDNMESNFASCMKEEARSARLGLKEDLEDIRREEEEERLKALRKKQMKKR